MCAWHWYDKGIVKWQLLHAQIFHISKKIFLILPKFYKKTTSLSGYIKIVVQEEKAVHAILPPFMDKEKG